MTPPTAMLSVLLAAAPGPSLDLDMGDAAGAWQVVLDGVMGGRSTGRLDVPAPGVLGFSGLLSLENNGGFSQIRTRVDGADLDGADGIELRVRGDGRTYQFDIRCSNVRLMAGSYQALFGTEAGNWQTIRLPFEAFELHDFGRRIANPPPLRPDLIESIGVTVADKQPGPFRLEIDRVRALGADAGGDDVLEVAAPRDARPATVMLIERAIERGVPVFNGGAPGACAAIYELAIVALAELAPDRLDDVTAARLRLAIAEGAEEHDDLARAWLYRAALDQSHARLSQRATGVARR